ncbi:glyoxalase [Nocardia neocaledoniensis NBRC 108232]|uniref:Putative enzyme related to lactoylglutathione lyase n=1 Tax=Nocardia neocaledoniensis TaxID=236511 RepID=A0A317NHD8_9NOCA|nr:VOC family protein [Nocardia neocaledoniensis]PWV74522.1 putative enzyme related to lactoylglutathione lyase [Nocardia neocaledoniensis]GEM33163.1 glyoxalase [Nocardia neocaledoniensis NBRC 108232]
MFRGLATVTVYADDIAAAEEWYTKALGVESYFSFPHEGPPAYVEFRIGDFGHELGIVDVRFAPHPKSEEPAGAIAYWHVDDLEKTLAHLLSIGAKDHDPVTHHGDGIGFITASVIDPFGNILGIMTNPHFLEVVEARKSETS